MKYRLRLGIPFTANSLGWWHAGTKEAVRVAASVARQVGSNRATLDRLGLMPAWMALQALASNSPPSAKSVSGSTRPGSSLAGLTCHVWEQRSKHTSSSALHTCADVSALHTSKTGFKLIYAIACLSRLHFLISQAHFNNPLAINSFTMQALSAPRKL